MPLEEPNPLPGPIEEEPKYVALEDMTPEQLLELEDRHLHMVMEQRGTRKMAEHIRGTLGAWKKMEEAGMPLTDEQKLAMIDRGNVVRMAAKDAVAAAPDDLRTWDGKPVPEPLRLKIEAKPEEGPAP